MKKSNKGSILLLLLLGTVAIVFGQSPVKSIKGRIVEEASGKPISRAVIELLRAKDSLPVRTAVSDTIGQFDLKLTNDDQYLLHITHINFEEFFSTVVSSNSIDTDLPPIKLKIRTKLLDEVVVKSRKPIITLIGDKLIVNPQNMAGTATSNALDLMKNMPGVSVENQDKLTLNGSSDITILIDDRKRTMSLDQAIRLLKTIPASNVKQVEISVGKSAQQDAAGGGGVINIVTKKQLGNGYNLQWTSQAVTNHYLGQSHNLYLNYKYNKFNFFVSTGIDRSYNYTFSNSNSTYGLAPDNLIVIDDGKTIEKGSSKYIDLGIDYELNKNHVIGVTASAYKARNRFQNTLSSRFEKQNGRTITNQNDQVTPETLNSFDFLYTGKLDTLGSKLKIDLGYLEGNARTRPNYNNLYTDNFGQLQDPVNILAFLPLDGHQFIAQADLEKNISKTQQWQLGFKHTKGYVDNRANYDTLRGNILFPDIKRRDDLSYEEGITAAYLAYRQTFKKKYTVIVGLRYENTLMRNRSNIIDSVNQRNFNDFFPSISISRNGEKIKTTLNFSRSISRPYYGYLNPYVTYIDEFTSQIGNGQLNPGYTYLVNLTNVFNNFLYFSVGYSKAYNLLFLMKRQVPDTTLTLIKPENALSYQSLYVSLSGSYSFYKEAWEGQLRAYGFMYKNQLYP